MKPALQFRLAQQLNLTPELRQSIRFLQLSTMALELEVRSILEHNVFLESEIDQSTVDDDAEPDDDGPTVEEVLDPRGDDSTDGSPPGPDHLSNLAASNDDFRAQLRWQLAMLDLPDDECSLGGAIIDSLDDDGFLRSSLAEIAALADVTVSIPQVESVLQRILRLDPPGIGARTVAECLTSQLEVLWPDDPRTPLALNLVANAFGDLLVNNTAALATNLGCSVEEAAGAIELIHSLSPRPVDAIRDTVAQPVFPDVLLRRQQGRWLVSVARNGLSPIRLNRDLVDSAAVLGNCSNGDAFRGQLAEARWLVRALAMREETLLKVSRAIVARQRGFFERGPDGLMPLTLREIADDIGVHESTVSRVTNGKYIQSPIGTFSLKYFFNAQLKTDDGFGCSAQSARIKIRSIVSAEDPASPLSDTAIAALLADEGIRIARRTIGKYREQLGIPAAAVRLHRHNSNSKDPVPGAQRRQNDYASVSYS